MLYSLQCSWITFDCMASMLNVFLSSKGDVFCVNEILTVLWKQYFYIVARRKAIQVNIWKLKHNILCNVWHLKKNNRKNNTDTRKLLVFTLTKQNFCHLASCCSLTTDGQTGRNNRQTNRQAEITDRRTDKPKTICPQSCDQRLNHRGAHYSSE